jgi:hypothetical protein
MRELCYATHITSPTDVSDVLGALETIAGQLPVICGQLAAWLDDEAESNRLLATGGPFAGDVPAAVATASHWLKQAEEVADQTRHALANAHMAVGGLVPADSN